MNKFTRENFRGCLLGGAIGDALGYEVELKSLKEIKRIYGDNGINDLALNTEGKALISDDTQMMLFTLEGLMNSEKNKKDQKTSIYESYLRWVYTQGYTIDERLMTGSLIEQKELINRRSPGRTCLSSLISGKMGGRNTRLNDFKGNGAAMRTAPIGLYYCNDAEKAFRLGIEAGSITHSHPTGYLAAGALAAIISSILQGNTIENSMDRAIELLIMQADSDETIKAMEKAKRLALSFNISDSEALKILGEGWIAEEAISIGLYCALRYQNDFKKALITAVNHDGDSDTTGMITGNILGAYHGEEGIPFEWIVKVELGRVIGSLSDELFCVTL